MRLKSSPHQYGQIALFLHWMIAICLFSALISGFAVDKIGPTAGIMLFLHMIFGFLSAVLTGIRILWWLLIDKRPDPVLPSRPVSLLVSFVKFFLYLLPVGMGISGMALLFNSGAMDLFPFLGSEMLPDFEEIKPRRPHGFGAKLLALMITLHITGALYHLYWIRDVTRMRIRWN